MRTEAWKKLPREPFIPGSPSVRHHHRNTHANPKRVSTSAIIESPAKRVSPGRRRANLQLASCLSARLRRRDHAHRGSARSHVMELIEHIETAPVRRGG
jgi:hypothetical protein